MIVVKHKNTLPRGAMESASLETFLTWPDKDYKQADLTLNLDQTLKIGPAWGQMTSRGLLKPKLFYEPITYANRWKSITKSEELRFTTQITIKAVGTIRHQHLRSWRGMKEHSAQQNFSAQQFFSQLYGVSQKTSFILTKLAIALYKEFNHAIGNSGCRRNLKDHTGILHRTSTVTHWNLEDIYSLFIWFSCCVA